MRAGELAIVAHNASFEISVIKRLYNIDMSESFIDTMELAAYNYRHKSLDNLSKELFATSNIDNLKSAAGKSLINKYCKMQSHSYKDIFSPENRDDLHSMIEYCKQDVLSMHACYSKIRNKLPIREVAVSMLTSRMNFYGFKMDKSLFIPLQSIVQLATEKAKENLKKIINSLVHVKAF